MENNLSDTYTATGTLIVTVFTANGALPVQGALVTIKGSSKEDSGVISVVTTAPPAAQSEKPGTEKPYATYNIEVDKENFFPQSYINVPIFAGTTSIQPVNLIPYTEYRGQALPPAETRITEFENPDL